MKLARDILVGGAPAGSAGGHWAIPVRAHVLGMI